MASIKQALLVMLEARLRDTITEEPRWDYQHWQQVGRIDTLKEVIALVEAMREREN